tara:strand:- start:71 stop:358 length:288 start_codon:yes stop_codon:yes gene_type:complete
MRDMKVLPDDFEEAFIGFTEKSMKNKFIAIYDRNKCLDIAMRNLKSDRDTAIIWFEKNIDETLMGDYDPLILFPMSYIQYLGYFTQVHRIEREDE